MNFQHISQRQKQSSFTFWRCFAATAAPQSIRGDGGYHHRAAPTIIIHLLSLLLASWPHISFSPCHSRDPLTFYRLLAYHLSLTLLITRARRKYLCSKIKINRSIRSEGKGRGGTSWLFGRFWISPIVGLRIYVICM